MFGIFKKDPLQVLNQEYARLTEQARDLQRNGDIKGFAAMTAKADEVFQQIASLKESKTSSKEH